MKLVLKNKRENMSRPLTSIEQEIIKLFCKKETNEIVDFESIAEMCLSDMKFFHSKEMWTELRIISELLDFICYALEEEDSVVTLIN